MDQTEEWKQYTPYPYCWVSSLGRVKRIYGNGNDKNLKPCTHYKGYQLIDLTRQPTRVRVFIHVMVARMFIENPENKQHVDHINEDKGDNRLSNLRWATNGENQRNITKLRTTNTTGCVGITSKKYKGVHWKWCVRISLNGKRIQLGHYDDYDDAVEARREGEKKYFGNYCPNHN